MKILKTLLSAAALGCLLASLSFAGNIYLTGHDLDFHCDGGSQCNALGAAINFVRSGDATPTLPILFVDSGTELATAAGQAGAKARDTIDGGGTINFTVVTPTAFAVPTFSLAGFSAIAFASAASCGGCDLTPADITLINSRSAAVQSFFNAGGGLLYLAGAGDRATYYASVPIPATAVAVSPPFTVTAAGLAAPFNLTNAGDANCCATHNSFALPGSGSPLVVLETDSAGFAETLAGGNVTITSSGFGGGGGTPEPATYILMLGPLGLFALVSRIRGHKALSKNL